MRGWILVFLLTAFSGCDDGSSPDDGGAADAAVDLTPARDLTGRDLAKPPCIYSPPTECPTPAPTYSKDVAPIINSICLECHDGRGAQWPLTDYKHVSDWQDTLHDDMITCTMPPVEATNSMTYDQRVIILQWLLCGLPN